jgi:hypothetical protein
MGNSLCIKTRCGDNDHKQPTNINAKPSNTKSLGTNQNHHEWLKETDKKIDILPKREKTYNEKTTKSNTKINGG